MGVTTQQVYDAVLSIKGQLETLGRTVQQNCTDIALLQRGEANNERRSDKRDIRVDSLDDAVHLMREDNARAIRTSAIIASIITAVAMVVVALLR